MKNVEGKTKNEKQKMKTEKWKMKNKKWQDFVFSVKLQFGKTLVSVQNKLALQKDFLFRTF